MTTALLGLILALSGAKGAATTADVVVLRGGDEIRGQVDTKSSRGRVVVIARRDWVRQHLADRFDAWQRAEAEDGAKARDQRAERLRQWRHDRKEAGDRDPIASWIDAEIRRLGTGVSDEPLMRIVLRSGEVERIKRAGPESSRFLRLAWKAGLGDPEGLGVDELKQALEGVGVPTGKGMDAGLEGLLPVGPEPDSAFAARRAATEVSYDRGAKFLRFGALVLPDSGAGGMPPALPDLATLLLRDRGSGDPLAPELAKLAGRGGAGALVTEMAIADDFTSVKVEVRLLAREGGRWRVVGSRIGEQRTDRIDERMQQAMGEDPQIREVFRIAEGFGLGQIGEEAKRKALGVGTAARLALTKARSAAQEDLERLAFPVDQPR